MRKALAGLTAVALLAVTGWLVMPRTVDAQGGGTVEVEVKYNGPAQVETIKVNKDTEQCGKETKVEKIAVGGNKGLANAVASIPGAKGQPTAKKVALDQKGCQFRPHVVATTPGEVDILNSDGILHNIHTYSTANPAINKAQPKFKKTMTEKFEKPEFIKVTCDVHSWMLGWIAVMPNPYFGVTNESGVAKIENAPAGKQTIEVWHETLGKVTKDVEVKPGQTTKVTVEMAKKEARRGGAETSMLNWWLPENVTSYGGDIDGLFHLIYAITAITGILVFVALIAFLVMYRDRPGRQARYTHGNTTLEIVWTVVPSLILVLLTFLSVPAWSKIKMSVPPTDFVVEVNAKQFNWQVTYPGADGKFGTPDDKQFLDELHVPTNKPVKVILKSQDVIHSFFVPSFRIKQDAVPGHTIQAWFDANKPGKYEWPCAELCGFGHSGMKGWVYVHTPGDYAKWAAENLKAETEATPAQEEKPKS